jgi:hypothetical protein
MRDDDSNELNCWGDSMWTILDDMIAVFVEAKIGRLC